MFEVSAQAYIRSIKVIFAVGCFAGLLKVLIGSPVLLIADLLLIGLVFIVAPTPEPGARTADRAAVKTALLLSAALVGLGICQSFNPNVPSPATGLFYFRISTYPFLCVFIGYKLLRIPAAVPGIYHFVLGVCAPINALYALVQSFRLDPLSIQLVKHLGWGQFGAVGTYRVTGFLQGSVQLGLLSAMGAGYFLARNIFLEKWKLRESILLFILFISLIASMSRASLLGFLTFAGIASVLLLPRLRIKTHLASFAAHLAILSIIPVAAVAYIGDLETIDMLMGRMETLGNIGQDASFKEGRIDNWRYKILPAMLKSPMGRGNGSTGTWRSGESEPYTEKILETESMYFTLALEQGWMGLALSAPLFLLAMAGTFLLVKNNGPPPGIEVAVILWIFAFAGITSPNMSAFPVTWLFFLSVPFALARLDLGTGFEEPGTIRKGATI